MAVLVACSLLLAPGLAPGYPFAAQAGPSRQAPTVPYQGHLTDAAGQPVADGSYDFTFGLYAAQADGQAAWTETQPGVPVRGGAFSVALGSVTPLPGAVLSGGAPWLEVAVRGPGEGGFTTLSPRQALSALSKTSDKAQAPAGAAVYDKPGDEAAGVGSIGAASSPACAHTHLYENWMGTNTAYTFRVEDTSTTTGDAIRGISHSNNYFYAGLMGWTYGSGTGTYGHSDTGNGVYAESGGAGATQAALRANNANTTHGMAAYITNNSDYATAHFQNNGSGQVLWLVNGGTNNAGAGGGDFIQARNNPQTDVQFRVATDGTVYSDGGIFLVSPADFAEMLPAAPGVEPGDVLAIGIDGQLTQSTAAYQTSVAGVYSTKPGFVGGQPIEGKAEGTIPLAVVGIVPTKASAENGAIRPGDLLVASATPGRAMRAGDNSPQGSVIGKAMQPLATGTGVIKVLVTLQ
jgi:hypothetical protein